MTAKHSVPVRGLSTTASSPLFQGRFGRMFRMEPATFGKTDTDAQNALAKLAKAMTSPADDPKDGRDDEESRR